MARPSARRTSVRQRRISAAVFGSQPWPTSSTAVCRSASLPARRSASGSGYPASISTCSRQLSTLERSLDSGSAVSVVSLIAASVRPPIDEPCLQKFAPPFLLGGAAYEGRELLLGAGDRLVEPPRELAEPGLQDPALRLRPRDQRLHAS